MKPSYWLSLAAVAAAGSLFAQQPAPTPAGGAPLVLLLADYRIVQGTVERIGDPWLSGPFSMWLGHTYTHAGDSEGAARVVRRRAHGRPVGAV